MENPTISNPFATMATPNRHPTKGSSTPATPNVEPKSEYLRNALEAKRAKNVAPEAAPIEPKEAFATPNSPDPWLDNAKDEDTPVRATPTRHIRRPSESGFLNRAINQREQQADKDRMKDALFSLNMKLELIRTQNNELKDKVEEANERIKELEPLEDENHDLRESNNDMELKMQDMVDEIVDLRKQNAEILQIQDESVVNMEQQNTALEEAAEIIVRLECEKDALAQECAALKKKVTNAQKIVETYDGSNKHPGRVYSIDDSRPSTSHFDSDYYSQPGSPPAQLIQPVKHQESPLAITDRAQKFLTLRKESKKSTQDLKKRFSDASLKQVRPTSVVPDVPPIPESQQLGRQQKAPAPRATQNLVGASTPRVKHSDHLPPAARTPKQTTPAPQVSPASSRSSGTSKAPGGGLRGMFHNGHQPDPRDTVAPRVVVATASNNSPAHHPNTNIRPSAVSTREGHRQAPPPDQRLQRQPSVMSSTADTEFLHTNTSSSEWDRHIPSSSVVSDLTSDLGVGVSVGVGGDYRDRWNRAVVQTEKDMARLMTTDTSTDPRVRHAAGPAVTGTEDNKKKAPKKKTFAARIGGEKNFLFNPEEDEDAFMERLKELQRERHAGGR
jgi:hypothetical protein